MINANKNKEPGILIVISGPSGCGKSTVLRELFKIAEYKYSVSATTRKPRNGETDGADYHFISREAFSKKISNGDMLEYVEYSGNYYGTLKEPVENMLNAGYNVVLEIEVEGALNIKEKFPHAVMIFLTPPDYAELEKRLRSRATESEEIIKTRLEKSQKEINCIDKYEYLVINERDEQKTTAFTINCIVAAEKHKINPQKAGNFWQKYFNNFSNR